MKKFIALFLVMIMALGLFAGCGEEKVENEAPATTEAGPAWTTVTEGKLTMVTNAYFPPYEYYDGEKIVGIDAEIAEAIAKELGLTLEIKDVQFESIISEKVGERSNLFSPKFFAQLMLLVSDGLIVQEALGSEAINPEEFVAQSLEYIKMLDQLV